MALKLLTLCQCLALAMAVAPLRLSGMADAGPAAAGGALGDAIKPATPVWPERFGATLFQNRSSNLALTTLYYDWKKQRNLNLIQTQLGARGEVWDVEHGNGTSFIFSRQEPLCKVLHFDVGILTPDWLANATLLGQEATDGFIVDVWTKARFINYHNDNASGRPVRWTFLESNADFHVMRWTPGDTLTDAHWQAPPYCFTGAACTDAAPCGPSVLDDPAATGRLMRPQSTGGAAAAAVVPQAAAVERR